MNLITLRENIERFLSLLIKSFIPLLFGQLTVTESFFLDLKNQHHIIERAQKDMLHEKHQDRALGARNDFHDR